MTTRQDKNLMNEIIRKKDEHNIYIIAHYYQRDEIQDIADFVGDSYAMALAARRSAAETILVAGVDFMAESAKILCPGKTILSPEPAATCPMANSITVKDVVDYREKYPESIVVTYVNTPAEIKAVSDICCTSSNALQILQKLPEESRVFFVPDQNLAANVSGSLGRTVDAYDSVCPIHQKVKPEDILELRQQYPGARVLAHPECRPEVIRTADYVGSTAGMVQYISGDQADAFIITTECGITHAIRQANPDKKLILASPDLICPNMKSITLEKILYSIEHRTTIIEVPENIRQKAAAALENMIAYTEVVSG